MSISERNSRDTTILDLVHFVKIYASSETLVFDLE